MPPKQNRRHDAIDEDEELDTQIDPNEEEDVPQEVDNGAAKQLNGKAKRKADKGKGKQVPDEDEDEGEDEGKGDDRLKAAEEENRHLHEELAQIRELFAQHQRDIERASRPAATAGAGSSHVDARERSSNTAAGLSNTRKRPLNATASGPPNDPNPSDNEDDDDGDDDGRDNTNVNIRIPPPDKKDTLTIGAIQRHLGLTDSREDHLLWLEWREQIRSWSSMANLDYDLTWKRQDKGRVGALVTLIRDRIPTFRRFVSNWAAEFLVQDYFNHRRGHRLSKARDDGSSPPKKKRRVATSNTTNGSSKEAGSAHEGEDQPRARPRPVARSPPPPEDDAAGDNRAAVNKEDRIDHNGYNDPPATSPSKQKRGGGTGANKTRNKAAPQGKGTANMGEASATGGLRTGPANGRTPGHRGAAGRGAATATGGGSGRGDASGRGLDIRMDIGPPPSMSTRSRSRLNNGPNSKRAEDTDGEPDRHGDE